MGQITLKGMKLAAELRKHTKSSQATDGMDALCSRIGRLAASHCRLAERACSVEMTEKQHARHDREDTRIESLITGLVALLPPARASVLHNGGQTKTAPLSVEFGGDPRGFTVKIKVPDERGGNTWGLGGLYGI